MSFSRIAPALSWSAYVLSAGDAARGNRQRVEDRRFGVVRIGRGEPAIASRYACDARGLIGRLDVDVEPRDGVDVRALALGLRVRLSSRASTASRPCRSGAGRADAGGEWIAPPAERDAPLRHGAGRIGRQRPAEAVNRADELERMEQGDGAVELRLRRGAAGGREGDRTELFGGGVLVLLRAERGEDDEQESGWRWQRMACGYRCQPSSSSLPWLPTSGGRAARKAVDLS